MSCGRGRRRVSCFGTGGSSAAIDIADVLGRGPQPTRRHDGAARAGRHNGWAVKRKGRLYASARRRNLRTGRGFGLARGGRHIGGGGFVMRAIRALAVLAACGCPAALGAPGPKDATPPVTVDGLIDGNPVAVDSRAAGVGAEAALKVL